MSKPTKGYSNDQLYDKLDNNYADNVNFFSGKEVIVQKPEKEETKKKDDEFNKKEEDEAWEEQVTSEENIDGLESIVKRFGQVCLARSTQEPVIDGNESLAGFAKNMLVALWEMIKDIGRWIKNLFTNKLARVDSRIRYTEQRRKIEGIKDGEIKYPPTIRRLMIPAKLSADPDWVYNCADVGVRFYEKVIKGHQELKKRIKSSVSGDIENYKRSTAEECLAKTITGESFGSLGTAQTDILPGNRIFVVRAPLADSPDSAITYFIESNLEPILKNKTFSSTPSLMDNALKTLHRYRDVIQSVQRNTSEIQREFEREVSGMLKGGGKEVSQETRVYLKWLANTNKRLINGTLQHAVHTMEALDDFINAGLR